MQEAVQYSRLRTKRAVAAEAPRAYVRQGEMDRTPAAEIYALHLEAPLEIVEPPRADLLHLALKYDAAFIGLALMLDCPLVTAERTTTPWVQKLRRQAVVIR